MLTDLQRSRLQECLDIPEVEYWRLVGFRADGTTPDIRRWNVGGQDDDTPDWPTLSEVLRIAFAARECSKFVLRAYGPKGVKQKKFVTFDPPNKSEIDGDSFVGDTETLSQTTVLLSSFKAISETFGTLYRVQGEQIDKIIAGTVKVMEQNTQLTGKVGDTLSALVEFERKRADERIAETRAIGEEMASKDLLALDLQKQIEAAAQSSGFWQTVGSEVVKDPAKLGEFAEQLTGIVMRGIQTYTMAKNGKSLPAPGST